MNRFSLTALACPGLVLLTLGACHHIQTPSLAFSDDGQYLPKAVGSGLVADSNSLIPDVPMPVGFKAVGSKCTWHYDGRVRVVHHLYQGHAEPGDTVAFYQQELPTDHWTLLDIQAAGDSTVLRYVKGPEKLAVRTKHSRGVSTVTIEIEGR